MAYFAVALARTGTDWAGSEVDLDDVEDIDAVTDLVREQAGETAGPALLFVEEDDEWFGIVRADADTDARVFISDRRVVERSDVAALLFGDAAEAEDDEEDEEDEESRRPQIEPAGDREIMADLGSPSGTLLHLCAQEGQLPADIIAALCENAGCLEQLEQLRET